MLHGKKGFERIVWAFKNVLNQSLAWLFCDLDSTPELNNGLIIRKAYQKIPMMLTYNPDDKPIKKHHPQWLDCAPLRSSYDQIIVPSLTGLISNDMPEAEIQERCGAIAEWIAMVQLGSPRVSADDDVDPYLSRYCVSASDESSLSDLISVKWHGLIPPKWTIQLFLCLMLVKVYFPIVLVRS